MSEIDWDTPEIAGRYDRNSDRQYQKGLALIGMMKIKKGDAVFHRPEASHAALRLAGRDDRREVRGSPGRPV
jgi:ectoine hydroxylase-related dioxygenase (phytanoyl-CoA dioxygenase family)